MGQSCRDLFPPLSSLSSYHARISSYAAQDSEPILLDVYEGSDCVSGNDEDVELLGV
jgi:hypothetical protein